MKLCLWIMAILGFSEIAFSQRSLEGSRVEEDTSKMGSFYSSVELRHHLNTYVSRDTQFVDRYAPALQARAQLGATMREGMIDAYLTAGAVKYPGTQQVVARRSEMEIDVYPLVNAFGKICQYNIIQFPQPTGGRPDEDENLPAGSIVTLGVAPTARFPMVFEGNRFILKTGVDLWTKLYSQKQYVESEDTDVRDDDHYGLTSESTSDARKEDASLHYYSEFMLGAATTPAFFSQITGEIAAFYASVYEPRYIEEFGFETETEYGVKRNSHYRFRLQFEISERARFVNDFYQFSGGLFATDKYDSDRRFRNVARLSYRL